VTLVKEYADYMTVLKSDIKDDTGLNKLTIKDILDST